MLQEFSQPSSLRSEVVKLYWSVSWRGQLRRFFCRLLGRPIELEYLAEVAASGEGHEQHYGGIHAVAMEHICGTEEKAPAFDAEFRPLGELPRQRWLSIAEARLSGESMPPVQLIEVQGCYYVRDGHHRISVARAFGEAFIDAEITRYQVR